MAHIGPTATGQVGGTTPAAPRRGGSRWLWRGLALLVVLAVAAGAWIAYTGLRAKDALETAAGALSGAQSALLDGDTATANAAVTQAATLTGEARSATSDPVWKVVGAVPLLGATPRSVTLATQAADEVVSVSLPQFVAAAETLDVRTLKNANGQVDLARFPPAGEQLAAAEASLRDAEQLMSEIPTAGVPGFVSTGTAQLSAKITEALGVSTVAGPLLQVAPQLLGAQGPQTYFLAFQSPVEARGTGGFLGAFGLVTVDQGDITNRDVETNEVLKDFSAPVVDLGPDYAELYGSDVRNWVNMNLSPNFPYAGVQWGQAMQDQFGQGVAGVVAIDITAVKYLIEATGPVTTPDGKVLDANNAIQYLGNDIYFEFAGDNEARKRYQAEIATDLLDRVIALDGGTTAVVQALSAAVAGRHLQMWATDQVAQESIAATPLAGATSADPGPYAQLVINNGAGNKMDFYLQRELTYTSGSCSAEERSSTVAVRLTNTVPLEGPLPEYITTRADTGAATAATRSNRSLVYVHLPIGARVSEVRLDGAPISASFGSELGRTVAYLPLDLPAGQAVSLELDVVEPVSSAQPMVPVQPMVLPQQTVINWKGC